MKARLVFALFAITLAACGGVLEIDPSNGKRAQSLSPELTVDDAVLGGFATATIKRKGPLTGVRIDLSVQCLQDEVVVMALDTTFGLEDSTSFPLDRTTIWPSGYAICTATPKFVHANGRLVQGDSATFHVIDSDDVPDAVPCGDGVCGADESCSSCEADCGLCEPEPRCGDAVCDDAETCSACEADCGPCEPEPFCGDAVCDGDESCSSCEADCGLCDPADVEANLFVSPDGDDANSGSESAPLRTVGRAAELVGAGDTVLVRAGTYLEDVTFARSGTASSPITFVGEAGAKLVTDRSQDDASVWIRADYVVFRGFDVEGNIHVRGHYNVVEDNYVHDSYQKGGIHLSASERNAADCTFNIVRRNRIYKTVGTGLYLEGQNHLVEQNEVWRIVDHAPDGSNQTDADGMRFFGSHHLVRGNYLHDIWQTDMAGAPHIDMMQTWEEAHDIVFDGNVMHNPNPSGSNRILMLERKADAGPVANLAWVNNIFIFSDDSSAFMNFNRKDGQPEITNMVIANNVFYSPNQVEKAASFNNITGVTFKNNMVLNTGKNGNPYVAFKESTGTSGIDCSNNLTFNTVGPVPDAVDACSEDVWLIDPMVEDIAGDDISELDFRPTAGSPLIDAGTDHGHTDHDIDGVSRPRDNGYDIGAYEYCP